MVEFLDENITAISCKKTVYSQERLYALRKMRRDVSIKGIDFKK
jgi:hypothetical protein